MPPFSFVHATASWTPLANDLPTSEVMPVRSKMPPTLISPLAGPWARAAAEVRARRKQRQRVTRMGSTSWGSIRERIQLPISLDALPAGSHAVGLEDEEEHDGETEDAE